MDDKIFKITLEVVALLATIITTFVIPWIKEKIGTEKLAKYEYWANIAVKSAEMIWSETGHGTDKKAYAVEFLSNMFNKKKTVITAEQLDALIEASVKALKIEEGK